MGLRFQKRIRIFKGLTINLSKTGASLSVGGRGATVNFSKRGTKTTVGIPGSGLSYSTLNKNSEVESPKEVIAPPTDLGLQTNPNSDVPSKSSSFSKFLLFVFALTVGFILGRFI